MASACRGISKGGALAFGWTVGVLLEAAVRRSRRVALGKMVKIVVRETLWGSPGLARIELEATLMRRINKILAIPEYSGHSVSFP